MEENRHGGMERRVKGLNQTRLGDCESKGDVQWEQAKVRAESELTAMPHRNQREIQAERRVLGEMELFDSLKDPSRVPPEW